MTTRRAAEWTRSSSGMRPAIEMHDQFTKPKTWTRYVVLTYALTIPADTNRASEEPRTTNHASRPPSGITSASRCSSASSGDGTTCPASTVPSTGTTEAASCSGTFSESATCGFSRSRSSDIVLPGMQGGCADVAPCNCSGRASPRCEVTHAAADVADASTCQRDMSDWDTGRSQGEE